VIDANRRRPQLVVIDLVLEAARRILTHEDRQEPM
jgi:hypothetical protein